MSHGNKRLKHVVSIRKKTFRQLEGFYAKPPNPFVSIAICGSAFSGARPENTYVAGKPGELGAGAWATAASKD
jgi:hypothetical protein